MIRFEGHLLGVLGLVALAGGGACGAGTAPPGQPPMAVLTAQALETVRQAFNQMSDRPRVVLLLSPT
jgi:hypothetical protein